MEDLKVRVSKYMSYLLRHNPEGLGMDEEGFVDFEELLVKLRRIYPEADMQLIREIVERSDRRRFGIRDGRIRALYGHSIPVRISFEEDREIDILYHGTTREAAPRILREGLKPMRRNWVHLSPTIELARWVALRRTNKPVILRVDATRARMDGLKFYRASEEVYLSGELPPKYLEVIMY
jgi:putative RNA 2'-phosphotransferase